MNLFTELIKFERGNVVQLKLKLNSSKQITSKSSLITIIYNA